MCGICGFSGAGSETDLRKMNEALFWRGPDEGDIWHDSLIMLGHRRLSILDLAHGHQPMRDDETGAVIVYNGEIYNHQELRLELEKLGRVFKSAHSDTETVLRAFLEWGPECFIRFNGMFACAIYLPHKRELWLARDRFGEKPLFYIQNRHGIAFASELAALRQWPGWSGDVDAGNVQRFFSWNYLTCGRTLFRDCKGVAPGSWLCADLTTGALRTRKYWQFELTPDDSLTDEKEGELVEELRALIIDAVKRRFLSDVPVGIFLSGGIDSSAVLAAATHGVEATRISAYTIGFREKSFDESSKAQKVASFLNVPIEIEMLTEDDLSGTIASTLSRMSEPFGDASLIPTAKLAHFTRKYVKVALSGDGGDELFGGYDPMAAIMPAALYRKVMPKTIHSFLRRLMSQIPSSDKNMSAEFRVKRVLKGLEYPQAMQLPVWMSGLEPAEIAEFFENPLSASELFADAVSLFENNPALGQLERALMFFTCLYLPDDILVKSDRASMMVSLETRAVFLDNDLVAFCQRLPTRFKYRHGKRKYLLKKALEAWLPPDILDQPKKGFGIPLNLWLRSLPEPGCAVPGLKPDVIDYCYHKHKKKRGDYRYFLWDLQSWANLPPGLRP